MSRCYDLIVMAAKFRTGITTTFPKNGDQGNEDKTKDGYCRLSSGHFFPHSSFKAIIVVHQLRIFRIFVLKIYDRSYHWEM